MERTQPTFVPEWLKNSDDKSALKSLRNKSSDTTCSYFRTPSAGSTRLMSYSSFGRNRDNNKEKAESRFRDYSDSFANILPSWFEKDGVKRSHSSYSNVPAKRVESSKRKSAADKTGDNNGNIRLDAWTSALAEMPMVGTIRPASTSATTNVTGCRNMAETLAQTAPQLSVGSQRLEELAVKESRQLIPTTPSMPKPLALNSFDKPKMKVLQTSHIVSPRPVSANADAAKTSSSSTVGKLHVLKPSRATPIAKETSSPSSGGKLPNSPHAATVKRPSPRAKSRNDFFNLMRKKSMANNNSSFVSPDTRSTESADDKAGDGGPEGGGENIIKNGKNDAILYSEEEEARFLRSLGWEETSEEDEGLTEEDISSFYRDVSKYVNSRMGFKGTQAKCLMPIKLHMGKSGGDTKVDS